MLVLGVGPPFEVTRLLQVEEKRALSPQMSQPLPLLVTTFLGRAGWWACGSRALTFMLP